MAASIGSMALKIILSSNNSFATCNVLTKTPLLPTISGFFIESKDINIIT